MFGVRTVAAVIGLALAAVAGPVAAAETAPSPRALVTAIDGLIDANYVIVEMRPVLKAALAKSLAAGRYDGVDPQTLSGRLTDDMRAVAHDKHLGVHFDPESAAAIDNAMDFLRGGDAAIIDIRHNGGGSPEASAYLASYFVPPGEKLVTFYLRNDPPTSSSTVKVHGAQLSGIPVYVLTSGFTASAAEEFASHVARLRFATLVGETTAGAAHRNEIYPLPGGYIISISIGRPELPGGGNWEGKGVAPQIATGADQALDAAHAAALGMLAAKAAAGERGMYQRLQAGAAARAAPATPALPLESYAGRYGVYTVAVEGDHLVASSTKGMKTKLLALTPDLFAADMDPTYEVRFIVDKNETTAIEFEPLNAPPSRTPKG